ncbi:MAG: YbaK/EbsC family protein [Alphaproteobacteria bacterium]|nr:YbaK/EbsC family protein [Alphaproteobacteria bacterium]
MGMAITVQDYLDEMEAVYDVIEHPYAPTSIGAAGRAHLPPERLAKGVVVKDENGVLTLTVVPSDRNVDLESLKETLQHDVELATEDEVIGKFDDCDPGAVPPLGNAYALRVLLDDDLMTQDQVYFESGDHRHLVHVNGEEFRRIMGGAEKGRFTQAA